MRLVGIQVEIAGVESLILVIKVIVLVVVGIGALILVIKVIVLVPVLVGIGALIYGELAACAAVCPPYDLLARIDEPFVHVIHP